MLVTAAVVNEKYEQEAHELLMWKENVQKCICNTFSQLAILLYAFGKEPIFCLKYIMVLLKMMVGYHLS